MLLDDSEWMVLWLVIFRRFALSKARHAEVVVGAFVAMYADLWGWER